MELSTFKIKKFILFSKLELSYISGRNFPSSKNKKTPLSSLLYFLIFREIELSGSNIKEFLIFRETETPKKFFIFQETELPYISEHGNSKKHLLFQEVPFRAHKIKRNLP